MNIVPLPEPGGDLAISQTDGRLAWEIAAEIAPIPDILKRFSISPADFKNKLKDPMFRTAIREAKSLWKSDLNVKQRIQIKAAMLVEDSLLDVFAIIKAEHMPAAAKLEAFEKLMKTADLAPKAGKPEGTGSGSFRINIHLGDSPAQSLVINGTELPALESA